MLNTLNTLQVYQASEIHLESAKPLLDIGYDSSTELKPGLHQFGFKFLLPSDIPSTFNGVYGQITYLAKVNAVFSGKLRTNHISSQGKCSL